jgi:hypothetical protein
VRAARGALIFSTLLSTLTCPLFPVLALRAQEPPPELTRRVAERESANAEARGHYAYRQEVLIEELPGRGQPAGRYQETRDVIFSPLGERTERSVGQAQSTLRQLQLTAEDFDDIRNIQPILLTPELLPRYEMRYRGEETVDGRDCWVLQVRPKQILQGLRLFEGTLWAEKKGLNIVRLEGQAVPPVYARVGGQLSENLFPHFATTRTELDGHWFPTLTFADDTLPFRAGALRVRMTIRYKDYKRFGAESKSTYEEPKQ